MRSYRQLLVGSLFLCVACGVVDLTNKSKKPGAQALINSQQAADCSNAGSSTAETDQSNVRLCGEFISTDTIKIDTKETKLNAANADAQSQMADLKANSFGCVYSTKLPDDNGISVEKVTVKSEVAANPTSTPAPTTETPSADCELLPNFLCYNGALPSSCPDGKSCILANACPTGYRCGDGLPVPDDGSFGSQCQKGCPLRKCLPPTTRIQTPSGPVAVRDLKRGMIVYSVDARGSRVAVPIARTGSQRTAIGHTVAHIRLADGREVRASATHPLADGRNIGDLRNKDSYDGSVVVSAALEPYNEDSTYDLLPSSATGLYWADDVLMGSTMMMFQTKIGLACH